MPTHDLWHFTVQTMAVCVICQKICHVRQSLYLCIAKVEEVEKQQVVRRLERFEHNGG